MFSFECRHCRARLPAYIHRELSPRARRRVAAHLSRCDSCNAAYIDYRDAAGSLKADIPAVGREFDRGRGWAAVQARLSKPDSSPRKRFQKRYGAAALLVAAALVLPGLTVNAPRAFALQTRLPLQQTPPIWVDSADTPDHGAPSIRVSATPGAKLDTPSVSAVTPPAQPNYAPTLIAQGQATYTPDGL
jgi:anti-sigma factor RsiW